MKTYNWHGWLVLDELDLPKGGAIQVHYWSGSRWEPACIFPNLEPETLFDPDKSDGWNEATEYCGLVPERMIRDNRVYWNFTVNFGGVPEGGTARLKVVRAGEGARPLSKEEIEVRPDYGDTVVLKNWHEWQGAPVHDYEGMVPNRQEEPADAPAGWCVANCTFGQPRLCCFGQKEVPPLRHNPGLSGKYDLYVCFKEERLECDLELPGRKISECILLHTGLLPFYRFWKEFFIGQYDFTTEDTIGILQSPSARVNRLRRFGDLFYLKLVPADRPAVQPLASSRRPSEIIFYSEPYSLAYLYRLIRLEDAETIALRYEELGVDKIVCQMGRVGSGVLYPNSVGVRARGGVVHGDDRQSSNGLDLMNQAMDVMEALPAACHRHGIKFLADIGISSCSPGSPTETRFAAEHRQYYLHSHALDFDEPEVLDFAAEHFRELARYDIDGLSVTHTRYPYYKTAKNIIDFHRLLVQKIGLERRRQLEISISFVVGYPEYYEAVETLLQEDLVDTIIPGNMMSIYPPVNIAPFVRLARKYGKNIHGLLDAWSRNYSGYGQILLTRPAEYAALADFYLAQGAQGLYFYQSEGILANPFDRQFVKSLKQR